MRDSWLSGDSRTWMTIAGTSAAETAIAFPIRLVASDGKARRVLPCPEWEPGLGLRIQKRVGAGFGVE